MLNSTNITNLVRSMTIKLHADAVHMNKELLKYGLEYDPYDLTTYPYYQNLSGEPHQFNTRVFINVIEENSLEPLTKDLLLYYPATRKELLKYSDYYTELIDRYPSNLKYIRGILTPIDKESAINAPEGTILSYNKDYIDIRETELIPTLEREIKYFLSRWSVNEFLLTDNLYIPALYVQLYSFIYKRIMVHRLRNINNYQIHTSYMYDVFASNFGIDKYVTFLNDSSRLWLVKHIKYIGYNIGREEIFNLLIEKVLNPNNVYVKEIQLLPTLMKLKDDFNYQTDSFKLIKDTHSLFLTDKNIESTNKSAITLQSILQSEYILDEYKDWYTIGSSHYNQIDKKLNEKFRLRERTRVYYLTRNEISVRLTSLITPLALEVALVRLFNQDRDTHFKFTDIYDITRDYTGYQIGLLLLYNLYKHIGRDTTVDIEKIHPFYLLKKQDILDYFYHEDSDGNELYEDKYNRIMSYLSMFDTPADMFKNTFTAYEELLIYTVNQNNQIRVTEWEMITECLRDRDDYIIKVKGKLEDLMDLHRVAYNRTDYRAAIVNILDEVLDYNIDEANESLKILNDIRELITRLTSYTIHPILDTDIADVTIYTGGIGLIGEFDIVSILDADGDYKGEIATTSNILVDDSEVNIHITNTLLANCEESDITVVPEFTVFVIDELLQYKPNISVQ